MKFIKFFAWEDRWVERALVARQKELDWMVKGTIYMHSTKTIANIVRSSCKFRGFLRPVDACPDLGVYHLLHGLRTSGQPTDHQRRIYSTYYGMHLVLYTDATAV